MTVKPEPSKTMKCKHCSSTVDTKRITIPIERKGKVVNYRKINACSKCLSIYYPEYSTTAGEGTLVPKYYKVMIRGRITTIKRK